MNDANKEYLANLPMRLMILASSAAVHQEIIVTPKVIQGHPGFEFMFPPDHEGHDSTFHAPHPIAIELHTRSAQCYVVEAEKELERIIDQKNAHNKQLARGKELLKGMSPGDIEALKMTLK
jgi:hypothetical protein